MKNKNRKIKCPMPPPKNLAWDKPSIVPPQHAGFGKYWIGDTLMDISTDRPIMSRAALRSLKERYRGEK